jgi:Fic-DOC domain mobile mystery protein B
MIPWTPIPGETPIDDISGLKIKGISTRRELNQFEAANIRKAIVKYLAATPSRTLAPFDFSWVLQLHEQMFGDVWKWAGVTRRSDKTIRVPWTQIEVMLFQLVGDLEYWEKEGKIELLEQAVMLHHKAVCIHPFENGNGRWSRLLANIWLKRHSHAITDWPETNVGHESEIRAEYLAAIRQANEGRYGPLIDLHRRFTPSS